LPEPVLPMIAMRTVVSYVLLAIFCQTVSNGGLKPTLVIANAGKLGAFREERPALVGAKAGLAGVGSCPPRAVAGSSVA
jgi:hypothetical protein